MRAMLAVLAVVMVSIGLSSGERVVSWPCCSVTILQHGQHYCSVNVSTPGALNQSLVKLD